MKKLGLSLLIAVLALPIAAVVTILMAGWCYGLTDAIVLLLGLAGLWRRQRKIPAAR